MTSIKPQLPGIGPNPQPAVCPQPAGVGALPVKDFAPKRPEIKAPPVQSAERGNSGDAAIAVIGKKITGQIKRLVQFGGQVPENVVYKKLLGDGTDPRNAFSIYFEPESKQTWADESGVAAFQAALRAGPQNGIASLVGDAAAFSKYDVIIDKKDKPTGANYMDLYFDDAKGTLNKSGGMVRVRVIEGGIGRLVTKLPGELIQGSPVMGRIESNYSLKEKTVTQLVAEAGPHNPDNPISVLINQFPELDLSTLRPRVRIDDVREQYILAPQGQQFGNKKDVYLLTLDHVGSTRVDPSKMKDLDDFKALVDGRKGKFTEVEIERMDASRQAADIGALIKLCGALTEKWGLINSPGTKAQRGMMVTAGGTRDV
jgi:hypothetical protein